ncbi:MAG TPA: hypothetical protein VN901_19735 [Candidatus Acidoferrales bacterium]|jgi:hypothetical protein|nr:hypothetical protein [Candidatus Acidoferrales bacterium]
MCPERPEKNQDYRQEARNIRAKARDVHDAEARAQLLLIASLYEKLSYLTDILVPSLHAKLSDHSRMEDPTEGTDAM